MLLMVIFGNRNWKEITEVYFQFEEEILGEPYFIPTDELYKLV